MSAGGASLCNRETICYSRSQLVYVRRLHQAYSCIIRFIHSSMSPAFLCNLNSVCHWYTALRVPHEWYSVPLCSPHNIKKDAHVRFCIAATMHRVYPAYATLRKVSSTPPYTALHTSPPSIVSEHNTAHRQDCRCSYLSSVHHTLSIAKILNKIAQLVPEAGILMSSADGWDASLPRHCQSATTAIILCYFAR